MDIFFSVVQLLGGLALFLYGMNVMGSGLEKVAGGKLQKILEKLTSNIFLGVLFGAVVTAAIQSSSATTVIVVGLVNAGILKLRQAIGVIMGANIGTTITAQILRLSDLEGGNFLLRFLQPKNLSPFIAIIGILLFMVCKKVRQKDLGTIFLGFSVLFTGMFSMEAAVNAYSSSPFFEDLFSTLTNPFLGVLAGAVVTAIIQSSSASVGILQALSVTGRITFSSAFPIIMGQNIGTCITPILSSIGANKNAKRSAMIHLYFNVIGTLLFLGGVYAFQYTVGFSFWDSVITKTGIANFHTLFNIVVTLVLIPFAGLLEKLAIMTVKAVDDKKAPQDDEDFAIMEERFLSTPSFAISQCEKLVGRMADMVKENYSKAACMLQKYDEKLAQLIRQNEDIIDIMEDRIGNYIVRLPVQELSEHESMVVTEILHLINELERIGDYSVNMVEKSEALFNKQASFSEKGLRELGVVCDAVGEIVDMAVNCYHTRDTRLANMIEPLEETIDVMEESLKTKHIQRLKEGKCSIDAGVIFLEALTDLERIADHCSNIAVYVIGNNESIPNLEHHDYLRQLHKGESEQYQALYNAYNQKYLSQIINKV